MSSKPFRGVISDWYLSANRVIGTCVYHVNDMRHNGIHVGGVMYTSAVESLKSINGSNAVMALETKNSMYVLVDRKETA